MTQTTIRTRRADANVMSERRPLEGMEVEMVGTGVSAQVAGWFLRNLGARASTASGVLPASNHWQEGDDGSLPTGTVAYATGLALAATGLLCFLGRKGAAVSTSDVARRLLLPTAFADRNGATDNSPLTWGKGALACDLRSPGDRESFDRLLTTLDNPAGLPAATIAARAQEWHLPVVDYVTREQALDDAAHPVVAGVGWGAGSDDHRPARARPARARPPTAQKLSTVPIHDPIAAGLPSRGDSGRPLAGFTVIDMTAMWAGPLATSLLAQAGAEVIKVEPSCRPDGMRGTPEMFAALNQGKARSDLDLRREDDRASFLELVSRADLVIDSFSPRVMPNLGLTPAALAEVGGTSLLTISMPAFPPGHRRSWIAYGTGVHAASGLGDIGDGRFAAPVVSYPDPVAGLTAFATALALVVGRSLGWRPRHVEVSILAATLPLLQFQT